MNLLDVFMPDDLCARCAEEEPSSDIKLSVKREGERPVKLHFCSERCLTQFVSGYWALKGTELDPEDLV